MKSSLDKFLDRAIDKCSATPSIKGSRMRDHDKVAVENKEAFDRTIASICSRDIDEPTVCMHFDECFQAKSTGCPGLKCEEYEV